MDPILNICLFCDSSCGTCSGLYQTDCLTCASENFQFKPLEIATNPITGSCNPLPAKPTDPDYYKCGNDLESVLY